MANSLYRLQIALVIVCCSATFFICTAYCVPGWVNFSFQSSSVTMMSIWYAILCPERDGCDVVYEDDVATRSLQFDDTTYHLETSYAFRFLNEYLEWTLWQVTSTLSVIFCLIGFFMAIVLVNFNELRRVRNGYALIGALIMFTAGVLIWIPCGMIANMYVKVRSDFEADTTYKASLDVPYAVVLAALGSIIAFVAVVLFLFLAQKFPYIRPGRHRKHKRRHDKGRSDLVPYPVAYVEGQPYSESSIGSDWNSYPSVGEYTIKKYREYFPSQFDNRFIPADDLYSSYSSRSSVVPVPAGTVVYPVLKPAVPPVPVVAVPVLPARPYPSHYTMVNPIPERTLLY